MEGDEAVAQHGIGILLARFKLIDQRNQVGAVVTPVSGELPHRIGRLVKDGRAQPELDVHRR